MSSTEESLVRFGNCIIISRGWSENSWKPDRFVGSLDTLPYKGFNDFCQARHL